MNVETQATDRPDAVSLGEWIAELEQRPVSQYRETVVHVAAAERQAEFLRDEHLLMRARLIRADAELREGRTEEAGKLARMINTWAAARDDEYLLACSHRTLTQFHFYIGDLAGALTNAVKAVSFLAEDAAPAIRVRHLMTLAIVLGDNGSAEAGLQRFREALDISAALRDHRQTLMIVGNMVRLLIAADDLPAATAAIAQMRELVTASGIPLDANQLISVAEVELANERYDVVEATLRPLTCDAGDLISTSASLPSAILILAEAHRRAGRFTLAQADLDNARRLVAERGLRHMQAMLLRQQAAQFAATDRFREAYETIVASHEVSTALRSAQRDAQARTLHAVFEATEARQASEHFREMAHRDALTGLYNRRYIDDRLPALLGEAVAYGRPLAVAIVDLDHFKRINDTLSHHTGDRVLQQIGQLLAQATAAQGFAARLGGEEFLVVLPNTGLDDAVRQYERLRERISSHHWEPITGALPVTASIGAAVTCEGESTQTDMLARADRNLYAAKHGGRDRVIAG